MSSVDSLQSGGAGLLFHLYSLNPWNSGDARVVDAAITEGFLSICSKHIDNLECQS